MILVDIIYLEMNSYIAFQYFARDYSEFEEGFKVGNEYWLGLKRVHE